MDEACSTGRVAAADGATVAAVATGEVAATTGAVAESTIGAAFDWLSLLVAKHN